MDDVDVIQYSSIQKLKNSHCSFFINLYSFIYLHYYRSDLLIINIINIAAVFI